MHKPSGFLSNLKWGFYTLLPNQWITVSIPSRQAQLALTFDDGPNPEHTPAILALLDQYEIKATFYLIGKNVQRYPELVKDIVARGHSLGNHSLNHSRFFRLPLSEQISEIQRTEIILSEIDGCKKHTFRPPNGLLTLPLLVELIRLGIPVVLWSLNSLDYLYTDVNQLVDAFDNQTTQPGDIILLHDDSSHTLEGLKRLIPMWQELGYSFVDCVA